MLINMKNYDIESLIKRHEDFKGKGLDNLLPEDLFEWVVLKEKMADLIIEMQSDYMETKNELDKLKSIRIIELKAEVNEQGKKVHTESTANAVLLQEFYDRDIQQGALKIGIDMLKNKVGNVLEYINLAKLKINMDKDYLYNVKD